MTTLKIFKLEDSKEEQPLSTFSEGKHIIGRGLLGCKDKRVSRNHAEINVAKNKAELSSIHINPCFFIAAEGKAIRTISQGSSAIELNDGDKFSFLASDYWFKIRFDRENSDNKSLVNEISTIEWNNEPNTSCFKRASSEDEDREPKKLKAADDSTSINETVIKQEPETSFTENNLENQETKSVLSNEDNKNSDGDGKSENKILSEDTNGEEENTAQVTSTQAEENCDIQEKEEDKVKETKTESNENDQVTANSSSERDKVEETKTESNENDQVTANSSSEKTKNDTLEDKPKDPDKPSCSSDDQKVTSRRDRCWYGMNCYRKNPQHRDDFSHPGDSDFESDPEDDRPECPFGGACYRRNLLHRRQYKHPGRPAPKPNAIANNQPAGAAAAIPGVAGPVNPPKKKRKPKKKKKAQDSEDLSQGLDLPKRARKQKKAQDVDLSDEDEYDLDDPFICDGDSSEFEISSDSEDSDSDYEDSQNADEGSQDLRRLKKEAKRFVKQKK